MRRIYTLSIAMTILGLASCEKLPSTEGTYQQVVLLDNMAVQDIKVKDEIGSEKSTEIKVRIANPMDTDSYFRISLDNQVINDYNKKNNVDYEMLPTQNIEMSYTLDGKTEKGTDLNVFIPKGAVVSSGTLKFSLKPMIAPNGEKLPGANNYAVAVKLHSNNPNIIAQSDRETSLFLVKRSFKTNVAHLQNRAFHAIYGEDTGAQQSGKKYDKDVSLDAWTMQYSIAPINASNNAGLMYPNFRIHTNSQLYNVLYGGRFLFNNGGLKLHFNTAKGKDFKFEALGRNEHPSADKWYHVAVTFQKVEGRPILKMYVNGELMFDSPAPEAITDMPIICFGNGNLNAYVREIRLWSKALTQGQVAATQNFVKPDSDGLELYIPYNESPVEADGKTLKNASTNPNKKMPEKWFLHLGGTSAQKLPQATYNTIVEF